MKTMSAMAIYRMKTLEVMSNVETDHEDYPVANAEIKLIDGDVKIGVIANEEGCVLLCDDFGCEPGRVNAYWFCEDEELEIGITQDYDPDSYYLDDDMVDDFLSDTDFMLDYLASMIE